MRSALFVPGLFMMWSASIHFILLCLGWLDAKLGFLGVLAGMFLAPATVLAVPIWKGIATGNWWMVLLLPMVWAGALLGGASGISPGLFSPGLSRSK